MTELGDELLVAYVDGQLERKQSRAVERVLEQDDVIARRVHALKNAHSRLEAAFEAILAGEEAIVAPPPPQGPEPSRDVQTCTRRGVQTQAPVQGCSARYHDPSVEDEAETIVTVRRSRPIPPNGRWR